MAEDEWFVLLISIGVAAFSWARLLAPALTVNRMFCRPQERAKILLVPATGLALLFFFLRRYADALVRASPVYLAFYIAVGAAWAGAAASLFPLLGLNLRTDVLERANPAARGAWIAGVFAVFFCFAGSNIGDGPGWWVVLFCAGISTGVLFLLILLLTGMTRVTERITVERDLTAGRRLAGFLVAAGLVLGRASAGDWTSVSATYVEFSRDGWPVLILLFLAAGLERLLGAMRSRNPEGLPGTGWPIAIVYVGFASLVILELGPW